MATSRGYYLQSCEIYPDAAAGFWDYGPLGTALKSRFLELWRKHIVRRDGMMEIDGSQIMSRSVFSASGHLESFADPVTTCKKCGITVRADRLIQERLKKNVPERMQVEMYNEMISENRIGCSECDGELGSVEKFNMMFKVGIGPSSDEAYLRPETCQSIFINFPRLFKVMRCKLPIGFAQVGRSFRNEISPRRSVMRMREFNQAEIEIFFNPGNIDNFPKFKEVETCEIRINNYGKSVKTMTFKDAIDEEILPNKFTAYYLSLIQNFYEKVGIDANRSRFRILGDDERAFYAGMAFDYEVETDIGWVELVACNHRTNYDLKRHSEVSGVDFTVLDGDEKILPHVFELSMGIDRSLYCILDHSFGKGGERQLLNLKSYLAPIQVAVFPLISRDGLPEKASSIHSSLKNDFNSFYDESGSIGRRYRRMDEIGTPFCITIDHQTLNDSTVTIRERDTMKQSRINVTEISSYLGKNVKA